MKMKTKTNTKGYRVAVVGVGAVGKEMLRCLKKSKIPMEEPVRVLARRERDIEVDGDTYHVETCTEESFAGIDIALFAGTEGEKGAAKTFAQAANRYGAIVIDNGADFRLVKGVPLVVPEVNPEDLDAVREGQKVIANPNCSTIQMVVALKPLYDRSRIQRVIVSTYQAVSGTGQAAIEELDQESVLVLHGRQPLGFSVYPHQIAFNLIPEIGSFDFNVISEMGRFQPLGYTSEEWKMVTETHKIMHDERIAITATTVRVPVFNAHSESIYIETERKITAEEAREIFRQAERDGKGIKLVDEEFERPDGKKSRTYPMPVDASGKDLVYVGRIREDPFIKTGLSLWVVADNLRKGAALNAVQIAECLIERGLV